MQVSQLTIVLLLIMNGLEFFLIQGPAGAPFRQKYWWCYLFFLQNIAGFLKIEIFIYPIWSKYWYCYSSLALEKNKYLSNCMFSLNIRPPLCMAFSWSFVRHLIHLVIRINRFPFALIWRFLSFFILVFFIFVSFFNILFSDYVFYGATRTDIDGLSSCASRSDSQTSLSYSKAVFSMNSFQGFIRTFLIKYSFRYLSLIHIWRCRRYSLCRSRWSPYH